MIKDLKEAYFDFSGENIQSLYNISNSFRIYSAHRDKGSRIINKLCDYLLAGIDVIFCSECFYTEFSGLKLQRNSFIAKNNSDEMEKEYCGILGTLKTSRIKSFTGQYKTPEIEKFIEKLKKGKF